MVREIITLQNGCYSNFVGTHFWNIQESSFEYSGDSSQPEIEHDVLFREGKNLLREVTYTPRLVVVDLKSNLGCLPLEGTLYPTPAHQNGGSEIPTWGDDVEVVEASRSEKNEFIKDLESEDQKYYQATNGVEKSNKKQIKAKTYKLEDKIKTWSDFKRLHFHPRSILTVNEEDDSFTSWSGGFEHGKYISYQVEDLVRVYAEECDNMQGFQVFSDVNNGFGGVLTSLMEYLSDEFRGKGLVVYPMLPVRNQKTATKVRSSSLATLLSLSESLKLATLVAPLSLNSDIFRQNPRKREFPRLIYDAACDYHTSAILATTLESITRVHRCHTDPQSLSHISQQLSIGSQKLVSTGAAIPIPFSSNYSCLPDMLCDHLDKSLWTSLTPCVDDATSKGDIVDRCFSQSLSINGFPPSAATAPTTHPEYNISQIHQCTNLTSVLKLYLEGKYVDSSSVVSVQQTPIKVDTPFPQIFHSSLTSTGFPRQDLNGKFRNKEFTMLPNGKSPVLRNSDSPVMTNVESLPVLTNVMNS
ncbi:protein misato homolog 1 [Ciona intestinalis]